MFSSIKEWCNIPLTVRHNTGKTGTGEPTYGSQTSYLCYVDSSLVTLFDDKGVEFTSDIQLYVEGSSPIKRLDEVTFEGSTYIVRKVRAYYLNGLVDIKVVYI